MDERRARILARVRQDFEVAGLDQIVLLMEMPRSRL